MPRSGDLTSSSLAMAVGVGLITLFLGLRLWYERRGRGEGELHGERAFFRLQDLRRALGIVLMTALALMTAYGGRISHRIGDKANLGFVVVWFSVVVLVVLLLVLALVDSMATLRFARRARQRMIRERLQIVQESLAASQHSETDDSPNPSPS